MSEGVVSRESELIKRLVKEAKIGGNPSEPVRNTDAIKLPSGMKERIVKMGQVKASEVMLEQQDATPKTHPISKSQPPSE